MTVDLDHAHEEDDKLRSVSYYQCLVTICSDLTLGTSPPITSAISAVSSYV